MPVHDDAKIEPQTSTKAEIQTMQCPNCERTLNYSKRTVMVTCTCGKTYRIEHHEY